MDVSSVNDDDVVVDDDDDDDDDDHNNDNDNNNDNNDDDDNKSNNIDENRSCTLTFFGQLSSNVRRAECNRRCTAWYTLANAHAGMTFWAPHNIEMHDRAHKHVFRCANKLTPTFLFF